MFEFRRWAILWLAPLLFCQAAWAKPAILNIRLGVHPGSTRVVVELSEPVAYRIGFLAGPPRLYVELPESDWRGTHLPGVLGQVASMATASNGGITKLTAGLRGPAKLGGVQMIPGTSAGQTRRLVIDLLPASGNDFTAALIAGPLDSAPPLTVGSLAVTTSQPSNPNPSGAGASSWPGSTPLLKPVSDIDLASSQSTGQTPVAAPVPIATPISAPVVASAVPATGPSSDVLQNNAASIGSAGWPAGVPLLKPLPTILPLVYIDPGHGGPDPGTIGQNGTYEKNVTLAVARELQRQLLASGRYRVKLTRDSDLFVPLRLRFEMARIDHADLFISLHADSSFVGDARGASIYTLSETSSDAEAAALATKENKADLIAGVDLSKQNVVVTSILIDLAQRETKNLSAHFAELLVEELGKVTLLLRNTHRFAGFAVLKAPDIPSVLIELGYLSDNQDEALLLSGAHRAKLAAAMLRAIDGYFAAVVVAGRS